MYQWIDQYNFYCEFPVKNIIIVGNKYDLEDQRLVSELEIRQFCESMDCHYVKCSVKSDEGVEELIEQTIKRCIDLESQLAGNGLSTSGAKNSGDGSSIFTLGGSDGLTSGDVKNINPMKLDVKKRNKGCCAGGKTAS